MKSPGSRAEWHLNRILIITAAGIAIAALAIGLILLFLPARKNIEPQGAKETAIENRPKASLPETVKVSDKDEDLVLSWHLYTECMAYKKADPAACLDTPPALINLMKSEGAVHYRAMQQEFSQDCMVSASDAILIKTGRSACSKIDKIKYSQAYEKCEYRAGLFVGLTGKSIGTEEADSLCRTNTGNDDEYNGCMSTITGNCSYREKTGSKYYTQLCSIHSARSETLDCESYAPE